ncbi:hypothetical protein, conserved [Leishmania tarentolae]|uniref:Secreted protein n=1 Tax=Leishmania tarentolae TaxID=5689 RepID=A0A640KVA8_LEITA|nr:hypothetical protein, conserved [Leishmania tarentolae]
MHRHIYIYILCVCLCMCLYSHAHVRSTFIFVLQDGLLLKLANPLNACQMFIEQQLTRRRCLGLRDCLCHTPHGCDVLRQRGLPLHGEGASGLCPRAVLGKVRQMGIVQIFIRSCTDEQRHRTATINAHHFFLHKCQVEFFLCHLCRCPEGAVAAHQLVKHRGLRKALGVDIVHDCCRVRVTV